MTGTTSEEEKQAGGVEEAVRRGGVLWRGDDLLLDPDPIGERGRRYFGEGVGSVGGGPMEWGGL